jgi:thioredoxin-like negative regulator of GroEL
MSRSHFALCILHFAFCIQSAWAIDFHDSLDAAREANEGSLPTVISFGAPSCGWCRKMELETFADERVEAVAGKFVWVKINVDDHQELAARFRVRGIPHTAVLDAQQRVLASRPGYLPADKFVAFLEQSLTNPQPPEDSIDDLVAQLEKAGPAPGRELIVRAVESLAKPDRVGRKPLLAALANTSPAAWPALLDLLADPRLAVRAAAIQALREATRSQLPFDPFASAETRAAQVSAWRVWVDEAR